MNNFLNSNYQRETWINFLQKQFLPDDFLLRREQTDINFKSKYIKPQAYWIGDCASLGDLAIIEVAHDSEHDPRIGVSRDAFRLMADHGLSKALFFFVSDNSNNYRFSLITLDLKLEGKDVKYKFSNPKRFSFFLGEEAKVHTPQEFLFEKGRIKDFEDLQSRFSIEVVNKEFYHEIQRLFYKLVGGKVKQGSKNFEFTPMLKLPSTTDHQTLQEFSVRLVGRLVFCWFLKKKKSAVGIPLIPENILSSRAIDSNYYHKVIEPLFFELLNTPIEERKSDFRKEEFDLIPFLNGGLFDPNLHEDYYKYLPFEKQYKPSFNLIVPDEWLKEFITLLETYNFTIDENTSIDIDLSVDPEMLGRIFENLLAEINPETGNTARKATGSYYTPRPIVEYMVDESLIQYLLTKLAPRFPETNQTSGHCEESSSDEIPQQSLLEMQIRDLLNYNVAETDLSKEQKIAVIDALDEIKVLDPACGSGAFPMGILQKMLLILQKVDPESIEWVIRQLEKIPNKLVREALEDKLMNENWKYKHKMGIIQNAIYGVDIQPIATEISKLRLFLTLIVDENIIDDKPNRNINPLPNLSFKFVTANTLIGLGATPDLDDWTIKHAYEECVTEIEEVRELYFYEFDKSGKVRLESKIKEIQLRLYEIVRNHQIQSAFFNKLIDWNPFEDKASGWFDPNWMFGIKDGFDIVIGNPPYIQLQKAFDENRKFADLYKEQNYKTFERTGDIYCLFYEKANQVLNDAGFCCLITSNKWMRANYGKALRRFLAEKTTPRIIIDFSGFKVFESATVDTNILIFQNSPLTEGCGFSRGVFSSPDNKSDRVFQNYKELPYNPKLKQRARDLRKSGNLAEVLFWNQVKNGKFMSLDFHRQKIIGNYIVDFYCPAIQLVVEIDGSSHNDKIEYDKERENYLESLGLEIIHYKDEDVKHNLSSVMEHLKEYSEKLLNTPSLRDTPLQEGNENTQSFGQTSTEGNTFACTMQNDYKKGLSIAEYFHKNCVPIPNLTEESWIISSSLEMKIKQKIEKIGTPLKDWDVSIYRGILTGFNEAFIISGAKKDELIAADPKSAEIIKPILRGRDIKRYKAEFADLWLIAIHNGFIIPLSQRGGSEADGVLKENISSDKSGTPLQEENFKKVPRINIEEYPAIKAHLDQYWEKIEKRYDQGDTPYNLRNCAYWQEFEKEKVVYNDINQKLSFCIASEGYYFNNTVYFITESIYNRYFLSILNSNLIDWYYRKISAQLGKKAVRMFSIYVENLPIPKIPPEKQKLFERIVDETLRRKGNTPSLCDTPLPEGNENTPSLCDTPLREGNTKRLEDQIDLMVYKLYELTYEEAKIVDPELDKVLAQFGLRKADYERMGVEELARLDAQ